MTTQRNRINPDLMEALQMLKFSVKQGQGLDFTSGTSKESEIMDLELMINEQVSVPEDINGFICRLNTEPSL